MSSEIKCPKCGTIMTMDEALVQKMVNIKVQKQVQEERDKILKEFEIQNKNRTDELEKKYLLEKEKRETSEKKELELINKQKALEEDKSRWELEKARQMLEEKSALAEEIRKQADEENRFKLLERDKKINDMQKALDEARRKGAQGSMQTQGEVLELSIEEMLKQTFPFDKIEPVPKGKNGVDILQVVCSNTGQTVGKIAWELKRTKNWTEDWVQKVKDDCRAAHGDIAIIASDVLPKEVENFGPYKGIWVCNYGIIKGVAAIMRNQLIAVSAAMASQVGKDQKMEALYDYLVSNSFAQKIQSLLETYQSMKTSLDGEKRAMTKIWAQREMQINRMEENTAKMFGEIKGIAGIALPEINILELEDPSQA